MSYSKPYTSPPFVNREHIDIHDLPYDILSTIFFYATSAKPLESWLAIKLMSVCCRWESIITTTPRCWTNPLLDLHDMHHYSTSHLDFKLYKKYSKRHNMDIRFDVRTPPSEENPAEGISPRILARIAEIGESIKSSRAHIRTLEILCNSTECLRVCMRFLTPQNDGDYLPLKNLHVEGTMGSNTTTSADREISRFLRKNRQVRLSVPTPHLKTSLPSLRRLKLHHVNLDWAALSIQGLERLSIMYPGPPVSSDVQPTWKPPTLAQLRRILAANAETLHQLKLTNAIDDTIAQGPVADGMLLLPKLACLKLAFVQLGATIRWIRSTTITSLEELQVKSLVPHCDKHALFSGLLFLSLTSHSWEFPKLKYVRFSGLSFDTLPGFSAPRFIIDGFRTLSVAEVITLKNPDDITLNALAIAANYAPNVSSAEPQAEPEALLCNYFGRTNIKIVSKRHDAIKDFINKCNIGLAWRNKAFKAGFPNATDNVDGGDFRFGGLSLPKAMYYSNIMFHPVALYSARRVVYH